MGNEEFVQRWPDLPYERWFTWQKARSGDASAASAIGPAALANALCVVAAHCDGSDESFHAALRPFERLCGNPDAAPDVAEAAELVREARWLEPFRRLPSVCWEHPFLEALAGRLAQNVIAFGESDDGLVYGVFVLLSLLNPTKLTNSSSSPKMPN